MRTLGVAVDSEGIADLDNTVVDATEGMAQRIRQRLLFRYGTWFLRPEAGIVRIQDWPVSDPDGLAMLGTTFADSLRALEEVTGVTGIDFRYDPRERIFHFEAVVQTVYGDLQVDEDVG